MIEFNDGREIDPLGNKEKQVIVAIQGLLKQLDPGLAQQIDKLLADKLKTIDDIVTSTEPRELDQEESSPEFGNLKDLLRPEPQDND